MDYKNVSTLKIHKLTQEQYDRELANGNIDSEALYMTPDEGVDLSLYATVEQLNAKADSSHPHTINDVENLQTSLDQMTEDLKGYTDTVVSSKVDSVTMAQQFETHNTSTTAHNDIRVAIQNLATKLQSFLDVDDTTVDQLSEVLTLIENNKGTLESLTTTKINVSDIIDNLETAANTQVLSANQGVVIKGLIDDLKTALTNGTFEVGLASKLSSSNGSATHPVYFDDGQPIATTYALDKAGAEFGLVKTGGDVTISEGVITVNDDSHNHTIAATASDDGVIVLVGVDGANGVSYSASHANSGVIAGTYKSVTVDAKGHVTGGSNPTTLAGYGIGDAYTKAEINTTVANLNTAIDSKTNQNAFSNIAVSGQTTVQAENTTDTLTLVAGDNVSITTNATNDSVTITATDTVYEHPTTNGNKHIPKDGSSGNYLKYSSAGTATWANLPSASTSALGIVQLTNSTSSTSTSTAATPSSVKSAYDLANTAKNAVATLQTTVDGKQATITGAATTITGNNLTASRVLVSNGSGKVAVSDVTSTELGYLDGVTSNVQAQLDGKASSGHTHTQYLTADNPTGSGYVSINRKSGTTVASRSIAMGADTTASAFASMATGQGTTASAQSAHAEGENTTASEVYSHAEGYETTASGEDSHAEGYKTTASGNHSHAEGYRSTASGSSSHAEGYQTAANGYAAHAEGYATTASSDYSHAEGNYTTALYNQHAQGHYNNTTTAKAGVSSGTSTTATAFVIGNGTDASASNAFRVTYAGQIFANNSITTSGRDYAEFFEWQDLNPNKEDRRGYFVTLDGDKIKIAQPNDYILGIVSGQPAVLGNGDEDWKGRYILDDFGALITEEFEYEEKVLNKETGEEEVVKKTGTKYKENPNYNPSLDYIQRGERPEWNAVGMLGVLSVRDDGTCEVNGYCKVAEGGIATASETGYRVIKRINDNIVEVVFR